jgi:hypothetical protein
LKTLFLIVAAIFTGIFLSPAQTNPSSTNGVDMEMQLAWPDGQVYISGVHSTDTEIYAVGTTNPSTYVDTINWELTAGGTRLQETTPTVGTYSGDMFYWPAGQWPEYIVGYDISLPSGNTNSTYDAEPLTDGTLTANIGPYNLVDSAADSGAGLAFTRNDQSQFTIETGGAPGSTGSEFYMISASVTENYWYEGGDDWLDELTPASQVQIGNLGNLTYTGTDPYYGIIETGSLWTALPVHSTLSITPVAIGSENRQIHLSAQPYQVVSQCVATTPANRARTILGVGEQVNLSFSPTLWTNAVWLTTAGSLSTNYGISTTFTAPSNAASATIKIFVAGKSTSISYKVIEPVGIDHAQIIGTNSFPLLAAGAGMTNAVWIAPTSVSFYRVNILEVGEDATNITGFFSQWTPQQLHHSTADHWTPLNQANELSDWAAFPSGGYSPWSAGGFEWIIPQKWQVIGSGLTNSMAGGSVQVFSIDDFGTARVTKYGNWIQRSTNNVITTN